MRKPDKELAEEFRQLFAEAVGELGAADPGGEPTDSEIALMVDTSRYTLAGRAAA